MFVGEHVFVEMVQVTQDYEGERDLFSLRQKEVLYHFNTAGGRILARYEAPADKFLFPRDPPRPGQLQTLSLCRSREYQASKIIIITQFSTLTHAMLHSTVQS